MQPAFVSGTDALERPVDETGQAVLPAPRLLATGLEDARAQHRRQRQRRDRRYRHRTDQREGEFGEQRAGQAALKTNRDVDRDQNQCHRDDRAAEFSRCHDRGGGRLLSFVQMPVDVFHDDDGVVDDKADGQNQRQQRQEIDGKAERQHDRERADQRQRYGETGIC